MNDDSLKDLKEMFYALDKDGDGTISVEEMREGTVPRRVGFPPFRVLMYGQCSHFPLCVNLSRDGYGAAKSNYRGCNVQRTNMCLSLRKPGHNTNQILLIRASP